MARHVTGTTGQFLNANTGGALAYPFSYSLRVKYPLTTGGVSLAYGEAYAAWDAEYLTSAASTQNAGYGKNATFGSAVYTHSGVIPAGWHLVVAVYASATDRRVYLDNSLQTGVDNSAAPFIGHTSKNFTLGGVLVSAGGLHTPAGFDGDIADAALWNTALTAADVDALAASRPGAIKAANLVAWWKLGEDGDLASSVGTYPPMSVIGAVPIADDPPYGVETPPGKLLYVPDHFGDDLELDVNHPILRDCGGFFPLRGDRPFWNPLRPDVPLVRRTDYGNTTVPTTAGDRNSTRFRAAPKLSIDANKQPAIIVSYPWSVTLGAWVKLNSAAGAGYGGGYHGIIGGDVTIFNDPQPASAPRLTIATNGTVLVHSTESFTKVFGSAPNMVLVGEWVHVVACFESIYHGVRYPNAYIWVNGRLVASLLNSAALGVNELHDNNCPISIGSVSWYTNYPAAEAIANADIKDAFYYRRKLDDAEVRFLYEQGDDLYISRTPRVYFHPAVIERHSIASVPGAPLVKGIGTVGAGLGTPVAFSKVAGAATVKGIATAATGTVSTAFSRVSGAATVYGLDQTATGAGTGPFARVSATALVRGIGQVATGVGSVAIARVAGLEFVGGIGANKLVQGFHSSLGSILYPAVLDREKQILFGKGATATFYSMSRAGETELITLKTGWSARRVPTIESGADEQWRVEVTSMDVTWAMVQTIATVEIFAATTQETQKYRVLQVENAMKPGHVYLLRCEAIEQK